VFPNAEIVPQTVRLKSRIGRLESLYKKKNQCRNESHAVLSGSPSNSGWLFASSAWKAERSIPVYASADQGRTFGLRRTAIVLPPGPRFTRQLVFASRCASGAGAVRITIEMWNE
jgi:hypothetical protein